VTAEEFVGGSKLGSSTMQGFDVGLLCDPDEHGHMAPLSAADGNEGE